MQQEAIEVCMFTRYSLVARFGGFVIYWLQTDLIFASYHGHWKVPCRKGWYHPFSFWWGYFSWVSGVLTWFQDIAQYIKKEVRKFLPRGAFFDGECCLHRSTVRRAQGCHMALCRRKELWKLRYTWWATWVGFRAGMMLTARTETKHFIYFYLGHNAILLFKTQ